ncbi:MAG: hypothetical protein WBD24_06705 [Candidatus Omnitrophota bacterium]
MKEKTVATIFITINAIGFILVLMSAFDMIPKLDNVLVFCGLVFFLIAAVANKLITKGGKS